MFIHCALSWLRKDLSAAERVAFADELEMFVPDRDSGRIAMRREFLDERGGELLHDA